MRSSWIGRKIYRSCLKRGGVESANKETFPHHFHDSPDIKHNRKPAPSISFAEPNLPTVIADCIALGTRSPDENGPG